MSESTTQTTTDNQSGEASSSTNTTSEPRPSSSSEPLKTCANCQKPEVFTSATSDDETSSSNLKPCISCHSVLYCSRDCKKANLKVHKKVCAKLAQEWAKTGEIKMASRSAPKADTFRGGLQKWQFDT